MQVCIVRHAIAFERDSERWPDDRERPLTRRGERRFAKAARGLATLVPDVDLVLSSPLVRARQTAEILTDHAGWPAQTPCPELEPEREPSELLDALRWRSGVASVALVGHEPHLTRLLAHFLTGEPDRLRGELKKGGVALLAVDEAMQAGHAELRLVLTPKVLRALV